MARFTVATENILRQAGWYPGRNVPNAVAGWRANVMLANFEMFPHAERVLLEFGGITINQQGAGETCAREPFNFDPTLAGYEDDRFREFSPVVNTRLYPLGEMANGHYFWAIGENEHIYIVMDDIRLLGLDLDEALENLIIGRAAKEIE